jgi:osmotically-inducible protein OsmY
MLIALFTISALTIIGGPAPARANDLKKSDSSVKIFVEYRLTKAGILTNNNVNVNVADGKITLTGMVPTLHDRMEAEKQARKVDKNYPVVNDLSVSAPFKPDSILAAAVLHRVETHDFYTAFDWLTVGVNNGVVTLHGWVSDPWEVHQYEAEAAKVPGVRKIVNNLRVEMTSGYLRYRVERLIYDDPLFWQYSQELNPPVHVVVNDGTVILEGYVDSMGERGFLASQVTFRTDAIRVVNHLQVVSD